MTFKKAWEEIESKKSNPHFLRNIIIVDADEFIERVQTANQETVEELVSSIYSGDAYILRNAISREVSENIKNKVVNWAQQEEENYQEMVEGCKNYHAITKDPRGPKGGYVSLEHSYVFFRHNKDELELFAEFDKYFQMVKSLSGNDPDSFLTNTPKDGVIDRITFIQYPVGYGKISTHYDPARTQKLLVGSIFSQIGEHYDYGENGFYLIDKTGKKMYLESLVDQGDFICAYPTMHHGVPLVKGNKKGDPDWNSTAGRWYVQCYSPESHENKDRLSAQAVKGTPSE